MSLTVAQALCGALLIALGLVFWLGGPALGPRLLAGLRSRAVGYAVLPVGVGWFLWEVTKLGPSDFGDQRWFLFGAFLLTAVGAFRYLSDFLAVRAVAVLGLMAANPFLDAAYMKWEYPTRLWMVGAVYVGIVAAITCGMTPYRARDFLEWLYRVPLRARVFGGLAVVYGGFLAGLCLAYNGA